MPSTTPAPDAPPSDPVTSTDPAALATYFDREFDGGRLRVGEVREQTPRSTSYDVTYRSERLTISGVLNVPTGPGPFPAVVLAHGWIDRDVYVRGQGMTRERGFLADNGYIAFHVDYRNHAESDDDPRLERGLYLGYAVDVINAVLALRASADVPVDDDRVAVMGRSMGGVAVYQVLEMLPGLVDAGIAFAPQSSREAENYHHWTPSVYDAVRAARGSPEQDPRFWREASTRTYFDRIEAPVLIHQGGRDEQCRPIWARQTARAMRGTDVDVTLRWYADERHAFGPQFGRAMRRTVTFLDQHLT
jgi:dipeptidyl aminopeptidase/acylaminoacyl peptidase